MIQHSTPGAVVRGAEPWEGRIKGKGSQILVRQASSSRIKGK